jgi:superfamily I DNA/RNA helicase
MGLTKEVPHHRLTIQPQIRPVLPKPSKEQINIINAINNGYCVTVKACAGSGKTTCMLQVAASLKSSRSVIIITYNRSLADECKVRISKLGLGNRIKCFTIHGFVTYLTGNICNNDQKLMQTLNSWDKNGYHASKTIPLDLVMLDEAQDLRPLFHKTLSYIFGGCGRSSTTPSSTITTSTMNDPSSSSSTSTSTSTSTSLSSTSTTTSTGGGTGMQLCLVGDPKVSFCLK